ncbi:aminotransferase class III-fold pyridoxal phosphate-dependent enzyme [Bosea sp. (in: a-proteobacteria)]|uniref:aminotransferase class III-fold pyridoxal phosphate-dependent enzyme n=1 Tax=Bosea sp. (in: a-proteobacteria) TaxID=1871050 RepID=UPI002734A2A0|nr:aminotransferase class III-fold pyridoxal phosphate-dependent enzyme [Bosea sp. (in: a-proteobacteria)]MDP3409015.1 aminotransferase class III-fold pyridoxal phosphate-dependent enzyme [Bosea sp. (in: a-proteobacteria)]
MSGDLVARDAAAFFHQDGSSPCVSALHGVDGVWLEDEDGRRLLDLHGNTAHHIGHAHPELIAALKDQLDTLPFSPRRFTNEPAVALAETLLSKWPGPPARALFATGGSDAIEIALKLARVATGKHETISIEGSYHGHGFGAFGLSRAAPDARLGPFLPGRHHVTPYWHQDDGALRMVADVRRALEASSRIGALIAEPIRSNCHVPPPWLWPQIRQLCDAHGVLLIFDEIPSGLGKTGRFFAFEHVGATPDAVVLGKALGGGILPIAAVIADARLNLAPELSLGHYTHEKNPMTTRAALTTIEIIERDGLIARAAGLERELHSRVAVMRKDNPLVDHIRGKGLLLAIGLDPERVNAARLPIATVVHLLREHGLSATAKDPSSFGFSPPLTITDAELDWALDRLQEAMMAASELTAPGSAAIQNGSRQRLNLDLDEDVIGGQA